MSMHTQAETSAGDPQRSGASIVKVVFASPSSAPPSSGTTSSSTARCASHVFGALFFPSSDPLTGTLLAFGTYALGFVARPWAGTRLGHGDKQWAARRCSSPR